MSSLINTKALVLHEMQIGDYDKRLILLTKEFGKIIAFAKGAKRPNSKLFAGTQIFSYGDFMLYKGKSNFNINQVMLIEPFHNLRQNIETLTYSLYILEFVEFITAENNPEHEIMKLTLKTLKQVEKAQIPLKLIIKIFELKAMSYIGYSPAIFNCVLCNSTEQLNFFSVKNGGILCDKCSSSQNDLILLSEGAVYTIRYILIQPLEKLFQFQLQEKVFNEINLVINRFIEYNLNKKFKTLDFLKQEI